MQPFYLPLNKGKDVWNKFDEEDHEEFAERLRKTLYYGKNPSTDRPSLPLTEIAVEYFQEACPRQLGKLDTFTAATTSRNACMSPCSVLMGMLYTKRLKTRNPAYLQQISSSDLFLISVMMASKYLYDEGIDDEVFNDEWAASADLETEDVNEMERQFLSAIDWQMFIRQKEFYDVLHNMEKRIALRQAKDRGWFTYTDLMVLSEDPDITKLVAYLRKELSKVIVVSSVAYLASVLTMVGSTLLVTTLSTAAVSHLAVTPALPPVLPQDSSSPISQCNKTTTISTDTGDDLQEQTPTRSSGTLDTFSKDIVDDGLTKGASVYYKGLSQLKNQVDGILSLFTMVTLKESFIRFVYSTKEKPGASPDSDNSLLPKKSFTPSHNMDLPHNKIPHTFHPVQRQNKSLHLNRKDFLLSDENPYSRLSVCALCVKCRKSVDGQKDGVPARDRHVVGCDKDPETVYSGFKDLTLHDHFSDTHRGFSTGPKSPAFLYT